MRENGEWTGETENRLLNKYNKQHKKNTHTRQDAVAAAAEVAESSNFKSPDSEMERPKLFS